MKILIHILIIFLFCGQCGEKPLLSYDNEKREIKIVPANYLINQVSINNERGDKLLAKLETTRYQNVSLLNSEEWNYFNNAKSRNQKIKDLLDTRVLSIKVFVKEKKNPSNRFSYHFNTKPKNEGNIQKIRPKILCP